MALIAEVEGTFLEITGLEPDTTYICEVSAVNAAGEGPLSDPLSVTTLPSVIKGILAVTSSPTDADAYVNDSLVGTTPLELEADPGVYNVVLKLAGYADYSTTAEVLAGETTTIDAVLTPLPPEKGILVVTSSPAGADVYVNDSLLGTTPLELSLDPATYEVRLVLAGYVSYVTTIEVLSSQTTTVDATLTPLPVEKGSLVVTSSPTGADVYLDGVFVGTTTLQLLLDPNTYNALLSLLGYEDYSATVEIIEGETTTLHVTLTPAKPPAVPWVAIAVGAGILALAALIIRGVRK